MRSEYNYLLLALSLGVSILAMLGVFALNENIFKASGELGKKSRRTMLAVFSIIAGSGLWLNHLLVAYSTLDNYKPSFYPVMLILGWFFSIGTCAVILDVGSKAQLPIKRLLVGASLSTLLIFGMFYADWRATLGATEFGFKRIDLLIALLVSTMVVIGNMLTFFWLKGYAGQHRKLIKVTLALIGGISIIAVHVAYNQAIFALSSVNDVSASGSFLNNKLVGIVITLTLLFMFSAIFTIVLLYEKYQMRRSTLKPVPIQEEVIEPLDALTKLPNRHAFDMHLTGAAKRCLRSSKTIAVAYVDLDHFKPINDQYGHHVGDVVLSVVAERLKAAIRGCDFVARIGGDEFVVIFEEIITEDDITPIVQRIVNSIKQPFTAGGHQIDISCSVGIAIYPHDGDTNGLMVRADAAMYKAKEAGKNQFKFFDEEIERASNQMRDMRTDLLAAIRNQQLSMMFQPKVDCKTYSPVGAEAVICWNHPEKGFLLPEQFLPAAERFGLINQINHWALEECCKLLTKAAQKQLRLQLSMNLSVVQFRRADLIDEIRQTLGSYQLRSDQLTFEIREISSIQNRTQLHQQLEEFRKAHIRISLDDFGSQSFSLDSLQNLNVNEVKLDKSFVSQIENDKTARSLVDAVIRLSHALNLNVVACGVENDVQSKLLKEMNCDQMQGYLFSRPVQQEALLNMFVQLDSGFESTGQFQLSDYQADTI
ncbi:MAG TPA: EAL domain-containing protein [Methylophilus sp.]|nr:EAL domain-containing protein [Methylophilus sp.]HQQ32821.1 EAL domain-containing protein [Methylophilus sp.]